MPRKTKTLKPFGGHQPTEKPDAIVPPAVGPAYMPPKRTEDRLKAIETAIEDNTAFIAKLKIQIENLTDTLKALQDILEERI